MSGRSLKTSIYLLAFTVSLVLLLVGAQATFISILAVSAFGAAILFIAFVIERQGSEKSLSFLSIVVLGLLAFALAEFLTGFDQFETRVLKETLSSKPMLLVIPPALFAGFAIIHMTKMETPAYRTVSMAPDIAFGAGLAGGFYGLLQLVTNGENDEGIVQVFLGNTIVHYLIIFIFFITLSYIIRCFVGVWARQSGTREDDRSALPNETSLRQFMRVLIGTLPLLGFLGTVLGITQALSGLPSLFAGGDGLGGDVSAALSRSLASIAVAFETTMLGLVASLIASLSLSYAEKMESDVSADLSASAEEDPL